MAVNQPRPLYTVTGSTPEMIRQPDGSYQHGYRVAFRTALGQDSYVIVPRSEDFEAVAHGAMHEEAQRLVSMANRPNIPLHQHQPKG